MCPSLWVSTCSTLPNFLQWFYVTGSTTVREYMINMIIKLILPKAFSREGVIALCSILDSKHKCVQSEDAGSLSTKQSGFNPTTLWGTKKWGEGFLTGTRKYLQKAGGSQEEPEMEQRKGIGKIPSEQEGYINKKARLIVIFPPVSILFPLLRTAASLRGRDREIYLWVHSWPGLYSEI